MQDKVTSTHLSRCMMLCTNEAYKSKSNFLPSVSENYYIVFVFKVLALTSPRGQQLSSSKYLFTRLPA